jgi:L-2-hydroxyglutarate oxidase LhgO
MADLKISQLTAVSTPVAGTEVLPVVQSGATKKATIAQLKPGLSLGTMADQNANAVAITGGTVTGVTAVYNSRGQITSSGGSTTTLFTLPNISSNKVYLLSVRQSGGNSNTVVAQVLAFGSGSGALRIAQDNTNPVLDMNITTSGLDVRLVIGSGFGSTTWDWVLTQLG